MQFLHLLQIKAKKYPKIKVLKTKGNKGRGITGILIRGVKKKFLFTYKFKEKKADFKMDIGLKKFKFDHDKDRLSYMGVGVSDKLKVLGELKSKKRK